MKRSLSIKLLITSLSLTICSSFVQAQKLVKQIGLKQQVENSGLVVEGKVISKESFFGEGNNIYTLNTIEVYKVFKGERISQVNVVTKGGSVGSKFQMVTHSLDLHMGDLGTFNLYSSNFSLSKIKGSLDNVFKVYSGQQGFYKYNLYDDVVVNTFTGKRGIVDSFYKDLTGFTKRDYSEIKTFSVKNETSKLRQTKGALVPSAISFAPTSASAGTGTTIVISIAGGATGDFGSVQGKVSFRNADSGGVDNGIPDYIDALDTQVTNWSTNSITVEVPSNAGTGNIRVTDALQNVIDSSVDLTVTYAEININFPKDFGDGEKIYAYPTRLLNNDGSGGYVWQMETSFDADVEQSGAKANYLAALDTWRCETGLNFTIGDVTPVDEAVVDGINIIRFDNGDELEENVLGQTTYSFRGCGSSPSNYEFFADEIDMVFDDGENWYYGPEDPGPGTQIDFQSVALHELGHAHQLGHVINDEDNDVMHYSIGFGEQQRTLFPDNIIAGGNVIDRSKTNGPIFLCFEGKSPMSEYDCQLSITNEELENTIRIYPNPTNGVFYIKNTSSVRLEKAIIYDVSGRLILQQDVSNDSSLTTIDLTGVSKGVYFINLLSDSGIITSKLLVD